MTASQGEFRYIDGTDPETGEVARTKFIVLALKPAGELAHGTLIKVIEIRDINGIDMARVKAGELEGWIPAQFLKASEGEETPILGR